MRIGYKCIVQNVGLTKSKIRKDKKYWVNSADYQSSLEGSFVRLALVATINTEKLHLYTLRKFDLKTGPQKAKKLNGKLLEYIESFFSKPKLIDVFAKESDDAISKSIKLNRSSRLKRLEKANLKPKLVPVTSYVYERNPDVVAEALYRADGICERCSGAAPFYRKSNNSPYLEVHHIVPLSNGGEDSLSNVLALCPNCHRELHFGKGI
ncbi:HNH endonuclease [Photobacterium chitinilyticum]|uniref:HNH endonuclease n=3 Tax=Photobacterium chitinilyticum TaxID=2485123 RepID=A0A444JI76_9GAMM|nr:HNH endonuclease [Photobacterium chitinilyticum]